VAFTALLALAVALLIAAVIIGLIAYRDLRLTVLALVHQATTDELTGLPNRRAATNRLSARLAAGHPVSVALIDVDDFKGINDTYGHAAGDAALQHLANCLTASARTHMAARISGDEFLIIVEGDVQRATDVARAVLRSVETAPFAYLDTPVAVELSIGVAQGNDISDVVEVIRRADHAMYHAKREVVRPRQPIATWTPDLRMPHQTDEPRRRTFRPPVRFPAR
jgi:diguanylate cyclase (GGDEF)-like protein